MARPLLLIGLGGFGKWVVTAFKTKIFDTYQGKKPDNIDWLSFDLVAEEKPLAKYERFELGKLKEETLDFSSTSQEFILYGGNFAYEIQKIREGKSDPRFDGRITKDDAEMIVVSQEKGIPAAERRHASMIQFVLDVEKIKRILARKMKGEVLLFLVNSLAGGTGTGTFIDFLLLLRKLLAPLHGTIISVILLPYGFTKVKQNEDMGPLHGNCYAAFREFLRLLSPEGNSRVFYSLSDLELQNVKKPKGVDLLSDLAFIVDGSNIGGEEGSGIEYYRGVAPAIAGFIENFFLAIKEKEEEKIRTKTVTTTFFDNAKTHVQTNFKGDKAKENPFNAFSFASFGSYRMIFDVEAIKTEFALQTALMIFDKFLAPSWLDNPEFAVKNYMLSHRESTKFEKDIFHDCITKLHQIGDFAISRSLKSRFESDIKFPDLHLGDKFTGTVRDTKDLIDKRENTWTGNENDRYEKRGRPTFYGVLNYYKDSYHSAFKKSIQDKIIEILSHGKGEDTYGKGNLRAAEHFIKVMREWYVLFLKGDSKRGVKSYFTSACEMADETEGTYENWKKTVDEYYSANQKKGKGMPVVGPDYRRQYCNMRTKLIELKARDLLRKSIAELASQNLTYIEKLHQELNNWIWTFENCQKRMQEALNGLLEVRNAKKGIVCDEYLTEPQDKIEGKIFNLITNYEEWKRIKEGITSEELEIRLKEIIDNIPHHRWSDFLGDFFWKFNLPDDMGVYPSTRHLPEELVCFVNTSAGMPGFPGRMDEWSREEYIRTWNYELVKYYLTHHRLNDLDKISAFQVLALRQDDSKEILERLKRKSEIMLFCDGTKLNELKDAGYPSHPPEDHLFVMGDYGYQDNQPKLKEFIKSFEEGREVAQGDKIDKVDVKEKSHEIVFITSRFCLPAPAMLHLANTEKVYQDRMNRRLPPPLHIFKGEEAAYKYETEIAKDYKSAYEKLHPRIVSILEDEALLRRILLARVFDLVEEKEERDSEHKTRYCLQIGSEKFFGEGGKLPNLSDVIYGLLYPPEGKEAAFNALIGDLGDKINSTLKGMNRKQIEKIKKEKIEEFKTKSKEEGPPQREKDLYKVWTVMLKEI